MLRDDPPREREQVSTSLPSGAVLRDGLTGAIDVTDTDYLLEAISRLRPATASSRRVQRRLS